MRQRVLGVGRAVANTVLDQNLRVGSPGRPDRSVSTSVLTHHGDPLGASRPVLDNPTTGPVRLARTLGAWVTVTPDDQAELTTSGADRVAAFVEPSSELAIG